MQRQIICENKFKNVCFTAEMGQMLSYQLIYK